MIVRNFWVKRVPRSDVSGFIERWHYSGTINGCIADYCYALFHEHTMIGAMFYGRMAMANQYRRFCADPARVIELRRLCCIDDTPKNTESFFIGKTLRLLRADWRDDGIVVSYADREHGHSGTIYRAANFTELAPIKGAKVIIYQGRVYHDKSIRTKYKGELKPFAQRIKAALDAGDAYYHQTAGKNTFIYNLRRGTKC